MHGFKASHGDLIVGALCASEDAVLVNSYRAKLLSMFKGHAARAMLT